MELPTYPKVVRIDSRFRTSGTGSDFEVTLDRPVTFPAGVRAYVSAVSLPHSWSNVEEGINDRLYVIETRTVGGAEQRKCRSLQLVSGNYTSLTLPTALAAALNSGSLFTGSLAYTVDYVPNRGTLRFQLAVASGGTPDASARFRLPSEDELTSVTWRAANWTGTADAYSSSDPDTIGDFLRLPNVSAGNTTFETGLLDVSPIHVLYLHSSLSGYESIGPRGETDIIQRLPVTSSYGYVLHYVSNGAAEEHFEVGGRSAQSLGFSLTNSRGRVVDLHGGNVSLELTFGENR